MAFSQDPPTPLGMRRPPASDPDEAIERVVPRKHLLPVDGDVLLFREPTGVKTQKARWGYRVQLIGTGLTSGTFATYEHALATAEQFASERRSRLFYAESREGQPQLLKGHP
jgi:hypothetical protein